MMFEILVENINEFIEPQSEQWWQTVPQKRDYFFFCTLSAQSALPIMNCIGLCRFQLPLNALITTQIALCFITTIERFIFQPNSPV